MARRERIYQGTLIAPDGTTGIHGEVWSDGAVAIVFRTPGNAQIAVLTQPIVELTTDGRLSVTGVPTGGDENVTWQAQPAPQVLINWVNSTVRYPDGTTLTGATVQATQYQVTVMKAGTEKRVMVGATANQAFGRRVINFGDEQIIVETKGGCGCGK